MGYLIAWCYLVKASRISKYVLLCPVPLIFHFLFFSIPILFSVPLVFHFLLHFLISSIILFTFFLFLLFLVDFLLFFNSFSSSCFSSISSFFFISFSPPSTFSSYSFFASLSPLLRLPSLFRLFFLVAGRSINEPVFRYFLPDRLAFAQQSLTCVRVAHCHGIISKSDSIPPPLQAHVTESTRYEWRGFIRP